MSAAAAVGVLVVAATLLLVVVVGRLRDRLLLGRWGGRR